MLAPDVLVSNKSIQEEVLWIMTLHVVNLDDPYHYLLPEDAREHIETNNVN